MSMMSALHAEAIERGIDPADPDALTLVQREMANDVVKRHLRRAIRALDDYRHAVVAVPGMSARDAVADMLALEALDLWAEEPDHYVSGHPTLDPARALSALVVASSGPSVWGEMRDDVEEKVQEGLAGLGLWVEEEV